MFPYPLEETRGSNKTTHDVRGKQVKFPSPTEVNGVSNPSGSLNMSSGRMCFRTLSRRLGFLTNENLDLIVGTHGFRTLSRRLGVLTEKSITKGYQLYVSVPYRGEWGVLRNSDTYKIFLKTMFPPPPEVTGVSNEFAAIVTTEGVVFPSPLEVNEGF